MYLGKHSSHCSSIIFHRKTTGISYNHRGWGKKSLDLGLNHFWKQPLVSVWTPHRSHIYPNFQNWYTLTLSCHIANGNIENSNSSDKSVTQAPQVTHAYGICPGISDLECGHVFRRPQVPVTHSFTSLQVLITEDLLTRSSNSSTWITWIEAWVRDGASQSGCVY